MQSRHQLASSRKEDQSMPLSFATYPRLEHPPCSLWFHYPSIMYGINTVFFVPQNGNTDQAFHSMTCPQWQSPPPNPYNKRRSFFLIFPSLTASDNASPIEADDVFP